MKTLIAAMVLFSVLAQADDYLDSINAEAKRIETIKQAKKELERARTERTAPKPTPPETAPVTVVRKNGLADMEDELRKLYPAAFSLYAKMDAAGKLKVLDVYLETRPGGKLSRQAAAIQQIISHSAK